MSTFGTGTGEDTPDRTARRERLLTRLGKALVVIALYFVLEVVTKGVVVVQFAVVAITRRPDPRLQRLGAMLADFMGQTWRYGCFATDIAPWPFGRWPSGRLPGAVRERNERIAP